MYWLREFLDGASHKFWDWYHGTKPGSDYDGSKSLLMSSTLRTQVQSLLFFNQGLLAALDEYSEFQRHLIRTAFACALVQDDRQLWDKCGNLRDHIMGGEFRITDAPDRVYRKLYDLAFPEADTEGLSLYSNLDWSWNPADSLELYGFCRAHRQPKLRLQRINLHVPWPVYSFA
ncbi:hypothetical protein [Deinococcus piscis]|uniref:hypothetical protein n=1 Tax=Deinococcus piscis TaxID=394230 RepID=UPI00167BD97C|nr:hypothetical protein [Deinococcus piscis]